ncbi:MAG: MutS-related protein [Anaerolineales bacterium]
MKVFLLYPDQDFNPQGKLPPQTEDLIRDLEFNTILEAMAKGDTFLYHVAKQALFTSLTDPQVIYYRQEILKDCLENQAIVRDLYQIPIKSIENKHSQWLGIFSNYPGGILSSAVQFLEMLVGLLHQLKQMADQYSHNFKSEGFTRFFQMIQQELDDAYFAEVEEHLQELKFRKGVLISAQLGRGNEGTNYILRRPNRNDDPWVLRMFSKRTPVYSYTIAPRDDHGARAIGALRDRGINLVANAVAQSADHIDNFLNTLRTELGFYIGCLNLAEQLPTFGEPITFPKAFLAEERYHACVGLYDIALPLLKQQKATGNDVEANRIDLIFITGANQGGKSTFLRSVGQAQLMMQSGMFVGGESFEANVCNSLFTHFRREEDTSMQSGKLDEELSRMSTIINELKPNSMILFNESFAATNEREGSEIARQIINALLERNIKIFFVTHQYELAQSFYEKKSPNILFLRAGRQTDGKRTFKLNVGKPLPTSFGKDVYKTVFK